MSENTIVLLVCLAVITALAILIYVSSRRQLSSLAAFCEIRQTLERVLAGNRSIEAALEHQRNVLNDAHKKIHAVTKGLLKPTS